MAETPAAAGTPSDTPTNPASSPSASAASDGPAPGPAALKKGSLVRVSKAAFQGSIEAQASDPAPPDYVFEGPAEILAVKGDYAQVRWNRPVPDGWLRLDQLVAV